MPNCLDSPPSTCQFESFNDANHATKGGNASTGPSWLKCALGVTRKWPPQGGEEDATTTTAECDSDGRFVVVSSSSDICRKDYRPAGEAPRVRRKTKTEMNDNNKDDDSRSLLSRLGNGSKRPRREHKETAMDMHTTIKQITRRGG